MFALGFFETLVVEKDDAGGAQGLLVKCVEGSLVFGVDLVEPKRVIRVTEIQPEFLSDCLLLVQNAEVAVVYGDGDDAQIPRFGHQPVDAGTGQAHPQRRSLLI